jgi:DNA-binding NarL/FixJ family response regulator
LRKTNPDEALETWQALVHGRWSMLDWFDSDQRRFVLAVPNPPDLGDPRGLTERELQVATYAALGETGKLIGYRLGLSKATVSNALDASKRKLGVKTQPQLAERMRGLTRGFLPREQS